MRRMYSTRNSEVNRAECLRRTAQSAKAEQEEKLLALEHYKAEVWGADAGRIHTLAMGTQSGTCLRA